MRLKAILCCSHSISDCLPTSTSENAKASASRAEKSPTSTLHNDEDECKVQSVDGSKAQAGDEFRAQEGQSRESRNSFETPEVAKKTEEALEIVDQLLAGAKPTDDQLVAIKAALLGHRDAWASQAEEDTFRDSLLGLVISQAPKAPAFVRQLPRGTTPAACYAPQLRRLLALSMNWQVPVYEIDRVSKGRPLSTIAMWICEELSLFDCVGLDPLRMRAFVVMVEQNYLDCPYHNKKHAASVTLMLFQIILKVGLATNLSVEKIGDVPLGLYVLAAIVAATVHDVHHLGVGSEFRVRTADEAAEQYHDQSVNENDHLAHALRIMKETGVFACLNAGARRVVRSTVISMVLKTDMSCHFDAAHKFKAAAARQGKDEEAILSTLAMFLKCADLGHCTLPWLDHVNWFKLLQEEYHRQGDMEVKLGLQVSFLTDRSKSLGPSQEVSLRGLSDLQAKFFEALVIPMYEDLVMIFPTLKPLLDGAQANCKQWLACGGVVEEAASITE